MPKEASGKYSKLLERHSRFACIDPGARVGGGTGVAIFQENVNCPFYTEIIQSTLESYDQRIVSIIERVAESFFVLPCGSPIFIEEPQYFDTFKGQTAARSNSLFKLIFFYGRLYERLRVTWHVCPMKIIDWKGQLSKSKTEKRVQKLTGVAFKGDVADAVGMGLFVKGLF